MKHTLKYYKQLALSVFFFAVGLGLMISATVLHLIEYKIGVIEYALSIILGGIVIYFGVKVPKRNTPSYEKLFKLLVIKQLIEHLKTRGNPRYLCPLIECMYDIRLEDNLLPEIAHVVREQLKSDEKQGSYRKGNRAISLFNDDHTFRDRYDFRIGLLHKARELVESEKMFIYNREYDYQQLYEKHK